MIKLIPTWLLRKIVYWAFNDGYLEIKRRNGIKTDYNYWSVE
jgi:hypothetical protein